MARSSTDLPRMQNQSRARAPLERSLSIVSQALEKAVKPKSPKPPMMRQYDLIERVKRYNPEHQRGAAQPRLCVRHEGARRAEARLRRPLLLPSARSRRDPDRSQARRRHHRRGAAARHDRGHRRDPRRDRPDVRPGHRRAGRGPDQAQEARPRHQGGEAGGEPAQAPAGDRRRRAGAAGQARRPAAQHAHAVAHAAGGAPPQRRGDARHLRSARRPHGHARDARGARGSGVPTSSIPKPTRSSASGSMRSRRKKSAWSPRSSSSSPESSPTAASTPRCRAGASAPIRSGARWSASRSASSSCPTSSASASSSSTLRRVLPGARHRAHDLAGGAGPLQGLRLDAEAERLSLDPHHRDRARQAARRAADPHRGDAPDRRIRHRRARALQGRRRLADRDAVAQIERLCVAAPHHRAARRGLQSGGVPRAHQARTVPRPGVLLHAQGQADRAAAPGERRSISPMRCTPTSATWRSAARSTARSRRCVSELTNGDEVEIITSKAQTAPPAAWESLVVTGKARAAIRRATRAAVRTQYAGLGRRIVERLCQRAKSAYSDEKLQGALPRLARASIDDVLSAVGRGEMRAADVVRAMYPDYKEERAARSRSSRSRRAAGSGSRRRRR